MKNLFCLLVAIWGLSLTSFAQLKIGIYQTDRSNAFPQSDRELVVSEFVKQIKQKCGCIVVNRDNAFNKALNEVHHYQQSGAVDDNQIVSMGKHTGENTVCIIDFRRNSDGTRIIEARYLDVETSEIVSSEIVNVSPNVKSFELQEIAIELARNLEERRKHPDRVAYNNKQSFVFNPRRGTHVCGFVGGKFYEEIGYDYVEKAFSSVSADCYLKYKKGIEYIHYDDIVFVGPCVMMGFGFIVATLWYNGGEFNPNGDRNAVAWAGLGVFGASFIYIVAQQPIYHSIGRCKIKSAIREYNRHNRNLSADNLELNFGFSNSGVGVALNF